MSPNINKLSNRLKASDLQGGDTLTFIDAGEWKEVDFSKARDGSDVKEVFQITVSVNEDMSFKTFTLNNTSGNSLSEKWGGMTEQWVNKKAKVTFIKMPVFGKMQDVLVLLPI